MTASEDDAGVDDLAAARAAVEEAAAEIETHGEEQVAAAADAYREADRLLERYRESATGTGNFEAYLEFQEKFARLVENLDDDLPARDAFEEANEVLDRRTIRDRQFDRARELLAEAETFVDLLERRTEAEDRYRTVRHEVRQRLDDLEARIDDLERLERLGTADVDAPVERLREPIEAYNEGVMAAFETFERETSARDLFEWIETTRAYPLVEIRRPPRDLREYVRDRPAGEESVPQLLEYADYSTSKLDHYVEDPGALKTRVAVHQTYLERLDGAPLQVEWPPPGGDRLRYRASELVAVVGRFAPEEVIEQLRTVRDLPRTTDYSRLREAAIARAELDEDERERLASGDVGDELARLQERRDELRQALEEY